MLGQSDNIKNRSTDPFRPQIHFAPLSGWMNDPNGLVFYKNEYHLFYQHIPDRTDHDGPLHWGHAKSRDLFHWEHLPVALFPDSKGDTWSGCIVVDTQNTCGLKLGKEQVMVALFTQNNNGNQEQGLAFSNDCGMNWTFYAENPVIPNPGLKDFRDPKVFWDDQTRRWIMVVTAGNCVRFYASQNLLIWELNGEFGENEGCHAGTWECPDLFELAVDGKEENRKWVMLVSVLDGAPNGGPGVQYFVGDFDGKNFVNHNPADQLLWLDYGSDNYAAATYSNIPKSEQRQICISWMNNWKYAQTLPTQNWRGMMTVPRQMMLNKSAGNELRLFSLPVVEKMNFIDATSKIKSQRIFPAKKIRLAEDNFKVPFELNINFKNLDAVEFGIQFENDLNEYVKLGYNVLESQLFMDRRNSGIVDFHPDFSETNDSAPLFMQNKELSLTVIVDVSSIEVFAEAGQVVMTILIFPHKPYNEICIYSEAGDVQLKRCIISEFTPTC